METSKTHLNKRAKVSIVVLTYNRPEQLSKLLGGLSHLEYADLEIIVVDNNSRCPVASVVSDVMPRVKVISLVENEGAVARNYGIEASTGDVVITLDDDVHGLNDTDIETACNLLRKHNVAVVCFKVTDPKDGRVINWSHPRKSEEYCNREFETSEIPELAVAFDRKVLVEAGMYPKDFFISHEGPDLAFRIINRGYKILYSPEITVVHEPAPQGRPSWRRYYYDTRNMFWLAARNYPLYFGLKKIIRKVGAMLVYALRDGFFIHWCRGVSHGVTGIGNALQQREKPLSATMIRIKEIERHKPGLFYMIKLRMFKKGIQI